MDTDRYAVPEGLDLKLVGTVQWGVHSLFGQVTSTLWLDPDGNAYYCEDTWTEDTPPFWEKTRMSDLIACDPTDYYWHMKGTLQLVAPADRQEMGEKFGELFDAWGAAVGRDLLVEIDWPRCVCCDADDDTVLSQDPSGEWWCTDCVNTCCKGAGRAE